MIRSVFENDPIGIHGRLTFLFRDLKWNTSLRTVEGLHTTIHNALRDQVPNGPFVVMIGKWDHDITAIDANGAATVLRFWAWGDDEPSAMERLTYLFDCLHGCLKWVSDGVRAQAPSNPSP